MVIRFFDIVLSTISLVLISPLLFPVYIVLKLTGEHQAFYVQRRIGRGGKEFGLLKFITMVQNAENLPGGFLTQKNDPRVLPIGRFLRKTKINELPQLLNILLGQMSFVGPRPLPSLHFNLYNPEIQDTIAKIPPGLTGIGSVVFRDEERILDNVEMDRNIFFKTILVPYKGQLEYWYSENRNLYTYFLLILLTAWTIVRPRTIVWLRLFPDLPPVPDALCSLLGIEKTESIAYGADSETSVVI